jgi:hypothetical protein
VNFTHNLIEHSYEFLCCMNSLEREYWLLCQNIVFLVFVLIVWVIVILLEFWNSVFVTCIKTWTQLVEQGEYNVCTCVFRESSLF